MVRLRFHRAGKRSTAGLIANPALVTKIPHHGLQQMPPDTGWYGEVSCRQALCPGDSIVEWIHPVYVARGVFDLPTDRRFCHPESTDRNYVPENVISRCSFATPVWS